MNLKDLQSQMTSAGERKVIESLHDRGLCSVVPGGCPVCEERNVIAQAKSSLAQELYESGVKDYSRVADAIDDLIKARLGQ